MSATPSVIFAGFEGDVFDNTDDLWRGKFTDPDADGIYKLYATDETDNLDLNDLMTTVLPADLLGYHLHFFIPLEKMHLLDLITVFATAMNNFRNILMR